MGKNKETVLFGVSIGCFFLVAISFLLMPIEFSAKNMQVFNNLIGIMFWLFLLAGIITQIILGQIRKSWFIRNRIRRYQAKSKVGIISFAKNLPACISDCTFAISLIALIISLFATDGSGFICYVFMAILVFSFFMHCILNGKIYYFLTNQDKILSASGKKSSEETEKE